MWGRDVPVFRAPFCPSMLALSLFLSALVRDFSSSFSTSVRARTRCLRHRCLAATCHRLYPRCATLRCAFVAPFFTRQKRHLAFFSRSSPATASKNLLALRRLATVYHLYVDRAGQMSVAMLCSAMNKSP